MIYYAYLKPVGLHLLVGLLLLLLKNIKLHGALHKLQKVLRKT